VRGSQTSYKIEPSPSPTREPITISFYPEWIVAICIRAMNGWNAGVPGNGLSCDEKGDLVVYHKLTVADHQSFPNLGYIQEIWLTYELPDFE